MENKRYFYPYKKEYITRQNLINDILNMMSPRNITLYKYSILLSALSSLPNNLLKFIQYSMPQLKALNFNEQYDIIMKWIDERLFEDE